MKPIYATLDGYNQYMEETRDAVRMCPELSSGVEEEEDYEDADADTVYFDADLEGDFLDPVVSTAGSGSVFGVVRPDGVAMMVKIRKLPRILRADLHRIESGRIGPRILELSGNSSRSAGTLVFRKVPFEQFEEAMSAAEFARLMRNDQLGVVLTTAKHPDGEVSGFLNESLPL
jgi:hypothetical protein